MCFLSALFNLCFSSWQNRYIVPLYISHLYVQKTLMFHSSFAALISSSSLPLPQTNIVPFIRCLHILRGLVRLSLLQTTLLFLSQFAALSPWTSPSFFPQITIIVVGYFGGLTPRPFSFIGLSFLNPTADPTASSHKTHNVIFRTAWKRFSKLL